MSVILDQEFFNRLFRFFEQQRLPMPPRYERAPRRHLNDELKFPVPKWLEQQRKVHTKWSNRGEVHSEQPKRVDRPLAKEKGQRQKTTRQKTTRQLILEANRRRDAERAVSDGEVYAYVSRNHLSDAEIDQIMKAGPGGFLDAD